MDIGQDRLYDELCERSYQHSLQMLDILSDEFREENLWECDELSYYLYRREIRKYKKLSREEEQELIILKCSGDKEAFLKLVKTNLGYVVHVARKFMNYGVPLNDLISEGNIGLIKAVGNLMERGFSVRTYAKYWIVSSIQNVIDHYGIQVKWPAELNDIKRKTDKYISYFEKSNSRLPSDEEVSESLRIPLSKIQEVLAGNKVEVSIDRLISHIVGDGVADVGEILLQLNHEPDLNPYSTDEDMFLESVSIEIDEALHKLHDRERDILKMFFGLGCLEMSLEEIAYRLGLTRERVRQIKEKAIRRLKGQKSRELRKYLG